MSRTLITRTIEAPVEKVFHTVADIDQFSKAVPHIVKVEFLSDLKVGVGTRFRETRLMNGKEATTELEVREYVENDHVRFVADTHGTVWDTLFTVKPEGGRAVLTMTMDATTNKLINKVMLLLIGGMVRKAIEKDLDGVKAFCEGRPPGAV